MNSPVSRREFLGWIGVMGASGVLAQSNRATGLTHSPFRISVMQTNATVNITNAMAAPITYTYTNRLTIEVRDSTNMLAAAFNQSVNTLSLAHLQKALLTQGFRCL